MKASTEACCLLLHHSTPFPPPPPHLLLLLPLNQQQKWQNLTIPPPAPAHSFLAQHLYICRASKWDPNAESFRTQNFDYGYDDDDDVDSDDTLEQWDDVLQDYIDSIWILKVFRSYGWALPFIIISLLLTTGLKAFLLALALPLGQSTFSFAVQRMLSEKQNKRKHKPKIKKKSRTSSSRFVKRKEAENRLRNQPNKNTKMGYQTWIPQDEGSKDTSEKDVPSFGGWDELLKGSEFDAAGSLKNSAQTRSDKKPSESGFSSRVVKSDTPLLLRLLLAVFPFLGSWSKML